MTIFDVLRYPISTPPTTEELMACPPAIYKEWASYTFGTNETHPSIAALTLKRLVTPNENGYIYTEDDRIGTQAINELKAAIRRMDI